MRSYEAFSLNTFAIFELNSKGNKQIWQAISVAYKSQFKLYLSKSIMKKNVFLLALILFGQFSVFAFDYKVSLRDKIFNKTEYGFSVVKFIDGRLNKQNP
ncbi:MAG TPA: hypothetical protein VK835_03790 [Bacteroidia bacterium]|nr:hypothetical protein [Bacteroidia bacterium]